jgi:glucans biosynthesis protein C
MSRPTAAQVANPSRIPQLETTRSVLMILGIVAHSILVIPFFEPWLSGADAQTAAVLYNVIHVFRLPAYFIISGHLAAWLLQRTGTRGFLISRFKRITSVMIVAQLAIFLVFRFVGCQICQVQGSIDWLHNGWLHLWFLYYLVIISHIAIALVWASQRWWPGLSERIGEVMNRASFGWPVVLGLALVTALVPGVMTPEHTMVLDEGVIPNLGLLVTYGCFFAAGWAVYRAQAWQQIRGNPWQYAGLLIVSVVGIWSPLAAYMPPMLTRYLESLQGWAAALLLLALVFRLSSGGRKLWRYLDDASYWVYLWHVIPVLGFSWLLAKFHLPVWTYLGGVVAGALALSVATYQLAVRRTIVGLWLSGRRR